MPRKIYRDQITSDENWRKVNPKNVQLVERFIKYKNNNCSDTTINGYDSDGVYKDNSVSQIYIIKSIDYLLNINNNKKNNLINALLKYGIDYTKYKIIEKNILFDEFIDNEYNLNQGIVSLNSIQGVIFSNGSVVKDRYMNQLNCNGNILKYEL